MSSTTHSNILAGIHRIELPTPFLIGSVNVFLIEDDPLTLIDTGPNSGDAVYGLEESLQKLGFRIEDLERIFITHQHVDHLGLADILAKRSNAEISTLDLLAPVVEDLEQHREAEDQRNQTIMVRYGLSQAVIGVMLAASQSYAAWGCSVQVTHPIPDGAFLEFADRKFQVLHRPGHSPSDTVLWDYESEVLIAGDHLIKHVSSNPALHRPLGGKSGDSSDERTRSLPNYLRSLAETRELPVKVALSGHGEPIEDHVSLIDERLELHARRARRIAAIVKERPQTIPEIAQIIWGRAAHTQTFLTFSEVIGHLDLLMDQGEVKEQLGTDDIVRFVCPD